MRVESLLLMLFSDQCVSSYFHVALYLAVLVCVCVSGLRVYSTHVLVLSACTKVGCTNSSQVTLLTSQLPPGPLHRPRLTLLDSRTILVE